MLGPKLGPGLTLSRGPVGGPSLLKAGPDAPLGRVGADNRAICPPRADCLIDLEAAEGPRGGDLPSGTFTPWDCIDVLLSLRESIGDLTVL